MTTVVKLIPDGGAAGADANFFRSPKFLAVEGVTHTLTVESPDGSAAIPVVRRAIPNARGRDAISPSGYPGGSVTGSAPTLTGVDLSSLGLVSIFIRDCVVRPTLHGGRQRSRIFLHRP